MNWMKNTRDWGISRQLWWGHQIPAWYCDDCGETVVAKSAPCACPKCGSAKLTQDPDPLDTLSLIHISVQSCCGQSAFCAGSPSRALKMLMLPNTCPEAFSTMAHW